MTGSLFHLNASETVDLTPQLATQFSTMPASTTERDISPKRLDYLKKAVLNGTAISFCWAQAKVTETGETVRINGHHSSTMLTKLNGQFPAGLKAHIDTYTVPNNEALIVLFRQLDNRASARTVDDISGAYQGLHPGLVTVPKRAARRAIEGAAWFLRNVRGDAVPTGDDRLDQFNRLDLHPFIHMVGNILSVKTPEFVHSVVGAMFGAWERDPTDAERFFGDVSKQGGGNNADHPAVVLDAWLVDARDCKGDKKPTEREIYTACAVAWNAFRNHRSLTAIGRYNKKKGAPDLD